MGKWGSFPCEKGGYNTRALVHVGKRKIGEFEAFPTWPKGEVPHMEIIVGKVGYPGF